MLVSIILDLFPFSSGSECDEITLVEETTHLLSKQGIVLLNLAWYGLSLMFLLLSVEGMLTEFYRSFKEYVQDIYQFKCKQW